MLPVDPGNREVVYSEPGSVPKALGEVDVVFPMLHGPYGEDGTLQGLLELSGVPYVGAGVLASAVGQDKEYMKRVFASFGLHVGPYLVIRPREWDQDEAGARKKIVDFAGEHGWPLFVKPARAGSSIGITKVDVLRRPRRGDRGGPAPRPQDPRRVAAARPRDRVRGPGVRGRPAGQRARPRSRRSQSHDYYDFEAKYIDSTPGIVPAPLTPEETAEVQRLAVEAFEAASCEGLVRADFFLTEDGEFVINEINTHAGLHAHLDVPADVGGERRQLPGAGGPAHPGGPEPLHGAALAPARRAQAIPVGIVFLTGAAKSVSGPRPSPARSSGRSPPRRRARAPVVKR